MPELPEVETTLRGIYPFAINQKIAAIRIRHYGLRWPVETSIPDNFLQRQIQVLTRRGKYLILSVSPRRHLLIHLGMSGSLRILVPEQSAMAADKHEHFDIRLENHYTIRYRDPRRFGALLQFDGDIQHHPLLAHLGPEPLSDAFEADRFYQLSRGKKQSIKQFIMDARNVVGVGNIYANEALFQAGIRPTRAAGRVSRKSFDKLHAAIILVLQQAIEQGGTTLKDFIAPAGSDKSLNQPGYFQQQLAVYGRQGLACVHCQTAIKAKTIGQRASYYCPRCQL